MGLDLWSKVTPPLEINPVVPIKVEVEPLSDHSNGKAAYCQISPKCFKIILQCGIAECKKSLHLKLHHELLVQNK